MDDRDDYLPWSQAWAASQYGPDGFYASQSPDEHFATAADNAVLVEALVALAREVDQALSHPDSFAVVDVGAGDGRLVEAFVQRAHTDDPDLAARLTATAIDVRPRPVSLDPSIAWICGTAPECMPELVTGMVLAHEWLDDVPLDIVERDTDGQLREVWVRTKDGDERLGPIVDESSPVAQWIHAWGRDSTHLTTDPASMPSTIRHEVGRHRDTAWAALIARLTAGVAVAIDYDVTAAGAGPTLDAFRRGRRVDPVPDGSCNLTAHVHLDACAAEATTQARQAGRTIRSRRLRQADAITTFAPRPAAELPQPSSPLDVLHHLSHRAAWTAATQAGGWGDHVWLVQVMGIAWPATLDPTT